MSLLSLLVLALLSGAALALFSPWLLMFLTSLAVLAAVAVFLLVSGAGFGSAAGAAILAMAALQVGYVVTGRVQEAFARRRLDPVEAPRLEKSDGGV